ncbi:MAG: cytochrome-c oxidase, cbb3-type subunit II [Myxococcota bacterium]|nr:cytochrome-c oxidase, cbb3-type subunit II [Myxococcota bacterium]
MENRFVPFALLTTLAVAVGGLVLVIPPFFLQGTVEPIEGHRPYTALEQEGRDLYLREGCNTCHSQQIRPFKTETDRYGPYSTAGESVYDHPFLFGSRRTGPDLARVGGKYPDSWHWIHFNNPRDLEPRSNMPDFAFLLDTELDLSLTSRRLAVLKTLGVPYTDAEVENAAEDALRQMEEVAARLRKDGITLSDVQARSEGVAMIAYLQSLGLSRSAEPVQAAQLDRVDRMDLEPVEGGNAP